MNIRPIIREEATVRVFAEPDDVPVEGNACASGDDVFDQEVEHNILCRLRQGDFWAWATVAVIVTWGPFEGRAYLGCCSYTDEDDFRQPGGYFDDMLVEALEELNGTVRKTYQQMKERELAA